jgi:hypothetical protein
MTPLRIRINAATNAREGHHSIVMSRCHLLGLSATGIISSNRPRSCSNSRKNRKLPPLCLQSLLFEMAQAINHDRIVKSVIPSASCCPRAFFLKSLKTMPHIQTDPERQHQGQATLSLNATAKMDAVASLQWEKGYATRVVAFAPALHLMELQPEI